MKIQKKLLLATRRWERSRISSLCLLKGFVACPKSILVIVFALGCGSVNFRGGKQAHYQKIQFVTGDNEGCIYFSKFEYLQNSKDQTHSDKIRIVQSLARVLQDKG